MGTGVLGLLSELSGCDEASEKNEECYKGDLVVSPDECSADASF